LEQVLQLILTVRLSVFGLLIIVQFIKFEFEARGEFGRWNPKLLILTNLHLAQQYIHDIDI